MKSLTRHTFRAMGLAAALTAAGLAWAQAPAPLTPEQVKAQQDLAAAQAAVEKANKNAAAYAAEAEKTRVAKLYGSCTTCGTVTEIKTEKRKGSGGAVGIVGGAVAGGLLGHQVGGGSGQTVATVGGAVAGAAIGNEIQKRMNRKTIHITTIKMQDGSIRKFESEQAPNWAVGSAVKLDMAANTVTKL
ncbi:MAG: hypothetical protein RL758_2078 [Pseudomonadota bacterium]|jgi:outer membrane lipoprotein SlyB